MRGCSVVFAIIGSLVTSSSAQSTASSAGAFPVHGSGSGTLGTSIKAPAEMMSVTSSTASISSPAMNSPTTMMNTMTLLMSKTSTSTMAAPTMVNNVTMYIVTTDITVIEIYMGSTSSSTKTLGMAPLATGVTHMVTVGGPTGDVYTPNTLNAAVGDIVLFTFMSDNHTLTQSSFSAPCMALFGGIGSGFMPNVNNSVSPPPTYKIQITTMNPLYFYCMQDDHCVNGMVFSINPTANMTEGAFMSKAMALNTGTVSTAMQVMPTSTMSIPIMSMVTTTRATTMMTSVAMAPPTLVAGTGTVVNGMCDCACLCGVAAFPTGAGIGSFGGLPGMAPQNALASVASMGMAT